MTNRKVYQGFRDDKTVEENWHMKEFNLSHMPNPLNMNKINLEVCTCLM